VAVLVSIEASMLRCGAFDRQRAQRESLLDASRELERFLASVEKRAFKIAQIAIRDVEDALDIVQDAMLQLARRYASRPAEEWKPLFYRILQNRIRDCQRRRQVRSRIFAWLPGRQNAEGEDLGDPMDLAPSHEPGPGEQTMMAGTLDALEAAVGKLPDRQRQAFLLRNFEGLDVAQTAAAMGCSEGSVKTHYFRAVHTLREALGEHW
jgi:RNA polymerase sigma-70 factor (ECF subfamily)